MCLLNKILKTLWSFDIDKHEVKQSIDLVRISQQKLDMQNISQLQRNLIVNFSPSYDLPTRSLMDDTTLQKKHTYSLN